jgi:DNA polymerase-1
MTEHKLLLIDGLGVAYRAFYAIRNLSTEGGVPTNALYGFIRMTQQLKHDWLPTHMAVVFDGGLPEERTEIVEDYKAQREPMPDELSVQLEAIDSYLDAARIPYILLEGQEADDVLATLAVEAAADGADVLLATSDKDLYQLVGESISIVPPSKGGMSMGPAEVEAKTGVKPSLMVDWQSLVGDAVDNVPGVPGVGPKTAAKWLNAYGDLETIFNELDDLKPERFRPVLAELKEAVLKNRDVVRLRTDLECGMPWHELAVQEAVTEELLAFFEKYELRGLARELRSGTTS